MSHREVSGEAVGGEREERAPPHCDFSLWPLTAHC